MKTDFREMLSRVMSSGLFLVLGIGLIWRAYQFSEPLDPSITGPLFCIILGMLLAITGLVVLMRGGDFETEETAPSGESHAA